MFLCLQFAWPNDFNVFFVCFLVFKCFNYLTFNGMVFARIWFRYSSFFLFLVLNVFISILNPIGMLIYVIIFLLLFVDDLYEL